MWPLLLKDGLSLPYVSCMLLFYAVAYHVFDLGRTKPLKQALVNMFTHNFVVHVNIGKNLLPPCQNLGKAMNWKKSSTQSLFTQD